MAFAKAAVSITGGGITLNNNPFPDAKFVSIGGFSARSTGTAVGGIFPATGQLQAKSVPSLLGRLHGNVLCEVTPGT